MEKPEFLYRGVKLNHKLLGQVPFYAVDIKPHYEPLIDNQGRKTVSDGNEYGIYMTDNLTMVQNAYAHVDVEDGLPLNKDLGRLFPPLNIPSVGIVYKIDTQGLDVHKPWITEHLNGHYNNGYEGEEWVVESIPADKYSVIEATIGPDWLHDAEQVNVSDITEAENTIKKSVKTRIQRLELLGNELEKLSLFKRSHLTIADRDLYKDLFGPNGVHYMDVAVYKPQNGKDYAKYLLGVFYHGTRDDLDYKSLQYIETLQSRLAVTDGVDRLSNLICDDITANANKRRVFVQKCRENGEDFTTVGFDKKEALYNDVLYVLNDKLNVKVKSKNQLVTDRGTDGFVTNIDKLLANSFKFVANQSNKLQNFSKEYAVATQKEDFELN